MIKDRDFSFLVSRAVTYVRFIHFSKGSISPMNVGPVSHYGVDPMSGRALIGRYTRDPFINEWKHYR